MNRRSFLGLGGITGVAVAAPALTLAASKETFVPKKPPLELSGQFGYATLVLGNLKTDAEVQLSVGEDNQLWIKPKNSNWKRLKVE